MREAILGIMINFFSHFTENPSPPFFCWPFYPCNHSFFSHLTRSYLLCLSLISGNPCGEIVAWQSLVALLNSVSSSFFLLRVPAVSEPASRFLPHPICLHDWAAPFRMHVGQPVLCHYWPAHTRIAYLDTYTRENTHARTHILYHNVILCQVYNLREGEFLAMHMHHNC